MVEKERRVSERSLENLKLGAESRRLGKVRHNFTILPETMQWLRGTGNASDTIDGLVLAVKCGALSSKYTHDQKEDKLTISDNVYERIILLEKENEQMRSQLEQTQAMLKASAEDHAEVASDGIKAADILKAALKLAPNAGGKIKREIEKALLLIDDV